MRHQGSRGYVAGAAGVVGLAGLMFTAGSVVSGAPQPEVAPLVEQAAGVTNPTIPETCGLDAVLVLDASGSISSSNAVSQVRDAGAAFLDALADTGSTARVLQFASLSQQLAPQTDVTQSAVDSGVFRDALDDYYNPKPPRPGNVNIYSYDGSGNPQSSSNWRSANGNNQYTNWDQSLGQAGETQANPIELVVYVTDGDPTAYDFDQPGDPFDAGPPPDVGVNTNRGGANALTEDRAEAAADAIKSGGARMLAVGVGKALQNPSSSARLELIAGPQVVEDADLPNINSINDVDVALVQDFDDLATFLRGVVIELCTPSISVSKYAQSPVTGEYVVASEANQAAFGVPVSWDITLTPTVTGGTFTWTLPDLNPPAAPYACDLTGTASRTCPTNASGVANFQWQPDPPTAQTSAVISETLQTDYEAGHPTNDDVKCKIKDADGNVDHLDGELVDAGGGNYTFQVPNVDPRAIVTCALYNNFDFQPAIALTKADDPRSVRGDAEADAAGDNETTSTFEVTNTGNAPLFNVTLTDDRCSPDRDDSTDVGADDVLSVGEAWTYTCTRTPTSSPGSAPQSIDNTADVIAVDAVGNQATATANDTIEVYAPAIDLVKTASEDQIPAGVATGVTYTYTATNTGNMTLNDVSVVDDQGTQTCATVVPVGATPPITLEPGDSQDFTCTVAITPADPTDVFTNTAVVTGQPAFPTGAPTALGPVGGPVTAEASAVVTSYTEGILLTKAVDPDLIFDDTLVSYTYTVENTGSVALENVVLTDDLTSLPGPIINGSCTSISGPTGPGAPTTLGAGDEWTYTCDTTIDVDNLDGSDRFIINVADVSATTVGVGDTLVDFAPAVVEIVTPELTIDKTAVRPVVLDADAIDTGVPPTGGAVAGPDVQPPRLAQYTYLVTNTGNLPVRNPVVEDTRPDSSPACSPIVPVPPAGNNAGDLNGNGDLDPGEAWGYTCETALDKDDSDVAVGPTEPGIVTNLAVASGEAFIPGSAPEQTQAVESSPDDAEVLVIQPSIDLQKTPCVDDGSGSLICDADPDDGDHLLVRPNTVVTYQYEVTNTGDVGVTPQLPLDDLCPAIAYVSGDTNSDTLLNVGETWLYECDYEVGNLADSPVVNTAGVAALGPLGNVYVDVDDATVRIFDPAIELVKTVSDDFVPVGSEVTYTFEVTNTGEYAIALGSPADVELAPVVLADVSEPANPACTSPTYVSGDVAPTGVLTVDPAETWVYTCTGTIDETTINLAGVEGIDIRNGPVFDLALQSVTPYEAGIDVVKTATPTQLDEPGGPVLYTYEVTNTGNVPLANVASQITDDTCSPVTYVSGDDDGNDLLTSEGDLFETGPPEIWVFECFAEITEDTTNIVTVEGTPTNPIVPEPLGPNVTDQDTVTVVVVPTTTSTTSTVAPLPPTPTTTIVVPLPPTGGGSGSRTAIPIAIALMLGGLGLVALTRRRSTETG